MPAKLTKSEFVAKAKETHGDKYSYKQVDMSDRKVKIYCKACREYFLQGRNSHIAGRGCASCGRKERNAKVSNTTESFIEKAKAIHGKKFDYSRVSYSNSYTKVCIGCRKCKSWFDQTPNRHISGRCGCLKCENVSRTKPQSQFIAEAKAVHGNRYDYTDTVYVNNKTPIVARCKTCNSTFECKVFSHLRGAGCTNVTCDNYIKHGYSKMALQWIESEAKSRRIKIQHAENGGEYRIPGTRFKVDGYHEKSNTVFEFHGDRYHGNPKVFNPNCKPNPFSTKTAKQLYKETREREKLLRSLGYVVVVMWERDWTLSRL